MRIAVLGLGVIGTTYAYALQKAGHETFHIVREGKNVPSSITVHLLDGRYNPKGEEKDGDYSVKTASQNEEYDFILISVASGKLNCVLFDHIMLESREKAKIKNYNELVSMLDSADIKQEIPHDMFEWIWIHMAINAGVTSTAAREGNIDDPNRLARELMADSKAFKYLLIYYLKNDNF